MSVNLTLALNIGTVIGAGLSTTVVSDYPLVALALAFACGVGATVSSQYSVSVGPFHDDPEK
jgi:hypothetical protein